MTGPHDPEDRGGEEEPWYATGDDGGAGYREPATAGLGGPEQEPATAEHPAPPSDPPTERTTVAGVPPDPRRQGWWRSRRVRAGAAATLAGLVLLGGGFGAGYAVADASAPPTAHTTAQGAGPGKQAARKRRQAVQQRRRQDGGATPAPEATAGAPTF